MVDIIKWPVILACPGENELPLLAELSARRDARVVAVIDPTGQSVGAGLAEVMGLALIRDLGEVPAGSARYLVHPPLNEEVSQLVDAAPEFGLEPVTVREFAALISGPKLAPVAQPAPPQCHIYLCRRLLKPPKVLARRALLEQ